ncbi:MAG: FtsP/CotA-like multicopper oxidase with cupredoxin domain [Parasphingorhabdus sp.]|jgi:FtsP/CotA-like multicopper oxidase with cupredoxin domain
MKAKQQKIYQSGFRVPRRHFLTQMASLSMATALPPLSWANQAPKTLTADLSRVTMGEAGELDVWAYNQSSPGPELRVKQGDFLDLKLENRLDQPTSIHWHGIRIVNSMDGVSGFTQPAVANGEVFNYRFQIPDAGTYWYHSHANSAEQVGRGLYGLLIVEEADAYPVDRELSLVIDDWRLDQIGEIQNDFGNLHDVSHGGRLGNWVTVNSQSQPDLSVTAGERIRLRLLNAANARIFTLKIADFAPWIIALDGQPVAPSQLTDSKITLAPGQRADLVVDIPMVATESAAITYIHSRGVLRIAQLITNTTVPLVRKKDTPPLLPNNPLPTTLDLKHGINIKVEMSGGAMGNMRSALYAGSHLRIRDLVGQGMAWSLNGVAGMTDTPLFRVQHGRTVTLNLVNDNSWPHAMHLHGHHFRVIEANGEATVDAPWRDTTLMYPMDQVRIAFVADNPGKWLLHCHMLEHSSAGMMTWFEVI